MKKAQTGIDCQVSPFFWFKNCAIRSALLSGASSSVGRWLSENLRPSRRKTRNSMPVSTAIRPKVGRSRQSEDHSSAITSILAGPFG